MHEPVAAGALDIPALTVLRGRRVVLASSSPRRKDLLARYGILPQIIPSEFPETLHKGDYAGSPGEYAKATAEAKALDVYTKLVVRRLPPDLLRRQYWFLLTPTRLQTDSPDDPPDLVIGADTIVILEDEILEKPASNASARSMLDSLNGRRHDVVTGVAIVVPQIQTPGYLARSFMETTAVHFGDNDPLLLEAYVNSGEGLDRAGGYAIQEKGGVLVRSIEGDFNNVMGFPCYAFIKYLSDLLEDEELFEDAL